MKLFWDLDLLSETGSQYSYSSFGYYLLGVILERVCGETYAQLLHDGIFEPLGMNNSTLDDDKSIVKNRASGYRRTLTGFENTSFRDMSTAKATGGILSTVEDLYLWDQALYTDKLLSKKYRDLLFKPNLGNYGYGWNIRKVPVGEEKETTLISHSGGISGFNSLIYRFVEDNHMIVMFKNIRNTVGLGQIMQKIGSILYDQPYELPKESAARKVALTSIESGVDAAVKEYHQLKNYHSDAYSFSEGDFNRIGYELLGMNKFDEAVAILKLNAEAYPASANTYDSLGEAYMLKGDTDSAIKNYKLALKKIPTDPNLSASGKEALKRGAEDKLSQLQAMAEKQ
ncbi:serine hydrolase [candidate division KSB1 bacterium]|nr:serine hydrolase [candidate division KSB1 bacterium]